MTTYPMVQAVAGPTEGAEVIFDFNEAGTWYSSTTEKEGWSLGSPARLSAAGDARTSWGSRRPTFSLNLYGERSRAVAAQSRLARWLLRPEGWVRFQLDAHAPPVWLRMLGAEPGDLDFGTIHVAGYGPDSWYLDVTFDADPFLYGERVTAFDGTLPNDPTLTAGMTAKLAPILGDAPAPLRVELGMPTQSTSTWRISSTNAEPVVVNFGTGDGFDTGVDLDTETFVTHPRYIGGSARVCTFASYAQMDYRATGNLPMPVKPGTYRMLVKTGVPQGQSGNFSFDLRGRVRWGNSLTAKVTPTIRLAGNSDWLAWADLGTVSLPTAMPDIDPTEFTYPSEAMGAACSVQMARNDGFTQAIVDAIVLVPVSLMGESATGRTLEVETDYGATGSIVFDGPREAAWHRSVSSGTRSATVGMRGSWPVAIPGLDNWVHVARSLHRPPHADPSERAWSVDSADTTTTAVISYHPQWLYLPSRAGDA